VNKIKHKNGLKKFYCGKPKREKQRAATSKTNPLIEREYNKRVSIQEINQREIVTHTVNKPSSPSQWNSKIGYSMNGPKGPK